jgi:ATP-dependent Zn protease
MSDDLLPYLALEDLVLARRSRQSADAYMSQIRALVAAKQAAPAAVTLGNLYGMDEAVAWGKALATDLAAYRAGILTWSAMDRGALLYGPPGTGKTIFSKALAASCRVPLIAASLAAWQGKGHLGDLLKAMIGTFEQAARMKPCILFIDEMDSFGHRGQFGEHHRDYGIQVVNGLLERLDGVAGREGVVVVGACNDPDRLDPAIVRSGRMDRMIKIGLPDHAALALILRHHLGDDLTNAEVRDAAFSGLGGTGADVERWVRGAHRRARYAGRAIEVADLLQEIHGTRAQPPSAILRRYAAHEAGHALIATLHWPGSVVRATIRQTNESGGDVICAPGTGDPFTHDDIRMNLQRILGGRAAEAVMFGSVTAPLAATDRVIWPKQRTWPRCP